MKITKQGEYAVILVCKLAVENKPVSLRYLSENCQMSYAFLRKVAFMLGRAGIIKGAEGKSGGYCIARKADRISLGEILTSVGEKMLAEPCCEGEKVCHTSAVCPRNSVINWLQRAIGESLDKITLDQLLRGEKSCVKMWKK